MKVEDWGLPLEEEEEEKEEKKEEEKKEEKKEKKEEKKEEEEGKERKRAREGGDKDSDEPLKKKKKDKKDKKEKKVKEEEKEEKMEAAPPGAAPRVPAPEWLVARWSGARGVTVLQRVMLLHVPSTGHDVPYPWSTAMVGQPAPPSPVTPIVATQGMGHVTLQ